MKSQAFRIKQQYLLRNKTEVLPGEAIILKAEDVSYLFH